MKAKNITILLLHAFVVWALCGALMAICLPLIGLKFALIVHIVFAPVFAGVVATWYYKKYNYTSPVLTAVAFVLFALIMDAGIVAPFFEKSSDMLKSILGTWLPLMFIFLATYGAGLPADAGQKT